MIFDKEPSYMKRARHLASNTRSVPANYYFEDVSTGYPYNRLVPGHVYTFEYLSDLDEKQIITIPDYLATNAIAQPSLSNKQRIANLEEISEKGYEIDRPYFDSKPIALAVGGFDDPRYEYVLNIKCMNPMDRTQVMEVLFRAVVPIMVRFGIDKNGNSLPFQQRVNTADYITKFINFKMGALTEFLGQGLYFWVNKYSKDRIRNIRLIEFEHLPMLELLRFERDRALKFNGASLYEVQQLFMNQIKNR